MSYGNARLNQLTYKHINISNKKIEEYLKKELVKNICQNIYRLTYLNDKLIFPKPPIEGNSHLI